MAWPMLNVPVPGGPGGMFASLPVLYAVQGQDEPALRLEHHHRPGAAPAATRHSPRDNEAITEDSSAFVFPGRSNTFTRHACSPWAISWPTSVDANCREIAGESSCPNSSTPGRLGRIRQ